MGVEHVWTKLHPWNLKCLTDAQYKISPYAAHLIVVLIRSQWNASSTTWGHRREKVLAGTAKMVQSFFCKTSLEVEQDQSQNGAGPVSKWYRASLKMMKDESQNSAGPVLEWHKTSLKMCRSSLATAQDQSQNGVGPVFKPVYLYGKPELPFINLNLPSPNLDNNVWPHQRNKNIRLCPMEAVHNQ